ncbi:MAG TPA: sterol desaturase family protein [Alphaproteobacteria bacterium]|nr:sterol desaturase family protein [Alphaproteobacteria bacterium]
MDFLRHILTDMVTGLIGPFVKIAQAGHYRLFWPYLLVATAIAYVVYRRARAAREPEAAGGFLAFVLPRALWRHRSAATDIGVLLVTSVVLALALPLIMPETKAITRWLLATVAPSAGVTAASPSTWQLAVFTLALLVVGDFARFFAHYLGHRVPAWWELHKVHHAAEVLTPFTAYRFHPIDVALTILIVTCLLGTANALFILAWGEGLQVVTLFHANAGLVVFNLLGGVLRHSHIWVSFGPRIERYLVSPAMHQIHHSCEPRHWGKNLGYHLSIWDRMFGSIYIPQTREHFELGLGEETAALRGVAASMVRPLIGAARALIPTALRRAGRAAEPTEPAARN